MTVDAPGFLELANAEQAGVERSLELDVGHPGLAVRVIIIGSKIRRFDFGNMRGDGWR